MRRDIQIDQSLYVIYGDDLLVRASPTNLIPDVVYKLLVGIRVENKIDLYRGIRFSIKGVDNDQNDRNDEWVNCEAVGNFRPEYRLFRLNKGWEISVMAERENPNQQLFKKVY